MTIKYLHVRGVNEKGEIYSNGGLTIAYTCTPTNICLQLALCNDCDPFCYDLGRRIAGSRLQSKKTGPRKDGTMRPEVVVLELKHPITQTIIDWLELEYFSVPIKIYLDPKHRWVTNFEADEGIEVVTDGDWQNQINLEMNRVEGDQGLRYAG